MKNITIEIGGDNMKLETSLEKLEHLIEESDSNIDFFEDENYVDLGSDVDEAFLFLKSLTKNEIAVYAEFNSETEYSRPITLVEIYFINCECPEDLKKYYNGSLLLVLEGKLIEFNSNTYKNIDLEKAWEYAEISNRGVECNDAKNDFYKYFTY